MPIYEYECKKCGEVFEVMQKYSDPPPKTHKSCGSRRVKRIMSRSSFILKGTGWYVTDYARKDKGDSGSNSKGSSGSKEKGESGSKEKGESGSTEKKPSSSEGKDSKGSSSKKATSGKNAA